VRTIPAIALCATLASAAGAGEFVFTFSGVVVDGSAAPGTAYTFRMFVLDTVQDATPGITTAHYDIARVELDLGSDGSVESGASITNAPNAFSRVYIDRGATQLVGGLDLFNADRSFVLGIHLPGDAFVDPSDLASQAAFSLSGLTSSAFSFLQFGQTNITVANDFFSFGRTIAVVPLPAPVLMGLLGLTTAAYAVRRRGRGRSGRVDGHAQLL
jgi:hypothetical protein